MADAKAMAPKKGHCFQSPGSFQGMCRTLQPFRSRIDRAFQFSVLHEQHINECRCHPVKGTICSGWPKIGIATETGQGVDRLRRQAEIDIGVMALPIRIWSPRKVAVILTNEPSDCSMSGTSYRQRKLAFS